jgi:hypothetical protein
MITYKGGAANKDGKLARNDLSRSAVLTYNRVDFKWSFNGMGGTEDAGVGQIMTGDPSWRICQNIILQ